MKENTPHDDLFKATFSMPSEVEAFMKTYLPAWIASQLDFNTLKKEPDSFINENLRQYFSDIIYSCHWKNSSKPVRLSFLLEHKSYIPQNIFIQLLRYLLEAYDFQYKSKEPMSLLIPVVVYHGEGKWKKRSFTSYFDLPDKRFERFIPTFDFELIDLKDLTDDLIINQSIGLYLRSTFLVFKHKNDKKFIEQFSQEIFIFVEQELNETQKIYFLRSLLQYIFRAFHFEKEEFQDYTKKLPKMIETIAGNLYDRLIREGREEGMEKGMEKGIIISQLEEKINLLDRLAAKNFNDATIADISGLDAAFVGEFIKTYAPEKVKALLAAIADARQPAKMEYIEQYLAQKMREYGFSEPVLSAYFKKPADELKDLPGDVTAGK